MKSLVIALIAAVGVTQIVPAATVTVLPGNPLWGNPPSENGGGGSSAITATAPRNGTGSVELFGDRTRFFGLGNPYDSSSNLGLLSALDVFTFEWSIAPGSASLLDPDYTPALRLHIWDGSQRSELIWEGAYNGTYGNTTQGTWYATGNNDNFWQFQSGIGPTLVYDRDISEWQGIYSSNAHIAAISIGAGSSVGAGYHALADSVTIGFNDLPVTTYNFEVASVPDVASSLLLLGGSLMGLAAFTRRRRRA
jgi:hypothetical protein